MKKIIILLLGVALIVGVVFLLMQPQPKEVSNKTEELSESITTQESIKQGNSTNQVNQTRPLKNKSRQAQEDDSTQSEEKLYTKEELDAAVSKAEVEMVEKVMRETVSEEEVTETVESVVDAFENSNQTSESSATQATINNYIHENGVYDKLAEEGVIFSGVECREAACKLEFEVNDTDDNLERRMPKMMSISQELSELETVRGKEAIITNDFEGRRLHYYYY